MILGEVVEGWGDWEDWEPENPVDGLEEEFAAREELFPRGARGVQEASKGGEI